MDELVEAGTLEDYTSTGTALDRELAQIQTGNQVEAELARLRGEIGSGEKKELEKESK
jgi:phage shock protein A